MRVIIAGSRDITDFDMLRELYDRCGVNITEVVSGTARGVDTLGEHLAAELGVPVKRFPADWDKHGKSAGYIRNAEMADYADALLLLWDGRSKGSGHMRKLAIDKGLPVYEGVVLTATLSAGFAAQ